jgi:thiol-disulfide isomerase/thioredoxin
MNSKRTVLSLLLIFLTSAQVFSQIRWAASLMHESAAEIPFLFEYDPEIGQNFVILNGEERIELKAETHGDSLKVAFEVYDAALIFLQAGAEIKGFWQRNIYGKITTMPFKAVKKPKLRQSLMPVSRHAEGKWAINFKGESDAAVGVFTQKNNDVLGTILTTTGDYRYLYGIIDENKLSLSTFNGAFAFKFEADFTKDDELSGVFYSGLSYMNMWTARKDEKAVLRDAYEMLKTKENVKAVFNFDNLDGEKLSLENERFKDKVVIIQILGSWCPNCLDETQFLAQFYEKYRAKNTEVVALAFERKNSLAEAKPFLEKLIKKYNVNYPVLYAGKADKKEVAEKLAFIDQIIAFPTTIILDKKHRVRKIHTGFSGQGTGKYFEEFVRHFETEIDTLLKEE